MNKYERLAVVAAVVVSNEVLSLAVLTYFGVKLCGKVLALAAKAR
jgi:hypothetical protein